MTEQQFRSIKLPLKSLLKKPDKNLPILLKYVSDVNTLVTYGYQFIRLYMLKCFDADEQLPKITDKFCEYALSVISFPDKKRKPDTQQAIFKEFYHSDFKTLIPAKSFDPHGLSSINQELSKEMETCLKNNISVHFVARLKSTICMLIQKREEFKDLSKGQTRRGAAMIINALWDKDPSELKPALIDIYDFCLKEFIPKEPFEKGLQYDVEVHPERYFLPTFKMNKFREQDKRKLFQPMSLRKSVVPRNIPIDTKTLIYLFDFSETTNHNVEYLLKNYVKDETIKPILWGFLFKMDKKAFKNRGRYSFFHAIHTDGIGCSLKFINNEYKVGHTVRYKSSENKTDTEKEAFKRFNNKGLKKQEKKKQEKIDKHLITDMTDEEKKSLLSTNLVGCDPGMANLVQMTDEHGNHLKYTRRQRYQETYISQNRKIKQKMRNEDGIQQLEAPLNDCNSKTMNIENFKAYISLKNQISQTTKKHYEQLSYRRMNLRHFIHVKKSESRLIGNIKEHFGEDCTILYGNWSRTTHMKYNAPVPGKGLKKLIAKNFTIVTIDEFKSSSVCFYDHKSIDNRKIAGKSLHRCLVCDECCSLKNGSKIRRFMNRDILGSLNIRMLGKCDLNNEERPLAYKRNAGRKGESKEDPFDKCSRVLPKKITIITPVVRRVV